MTNLNILSEVDFRKILKANPSGMYLFFGAEDYLKNYCIGAARQAICPDEGLACFNDIEIDFPDYSAEALEGALSTPPMMTERKLVVLRGFRFSVLKPTQIDALCAVLVQYREDESNLLILSVAPEGLDVGYLPKRPSALLQKLCESVTAVNFEEATPQKLILWVGRHFSEHGVKITEGNARLLIETCGRSMYNLASEIDKLASYVLAHGKDEVGAEDIRFVAVPEEACDAFALTNAIMAGNRREALEVLAVLKSRQIKQEYVFAELSRLYSDLYLTKLMLSSGKGVADVAALLHVHEYKAKLYRGAVEKVSMERLARALSLCRDADLAMKSYGKRNYEQLEKLVCVI